MKSIVFFVILSGVISIPAIAQDPANFHIIYGNRDGSVMNVRLGDTIEVQCWGATSPPGNPDIVDSVTFIHNPLMTNNNYIISRLGGTFPDTLVGRWDDRAFLPVYSNGNDPIIPVGFKSQSVLGFAYLNTPRDGFNFLHTEGDTVLICTFLMRTTTNSQYIGQTVCPFSQGHQPANGGLLWGMSDGLNGVVPTQTYGCIHFSPPCFYTPGDANGNGGFTGLDITYSVRYFKGGPHPSYSCDCPPHGNWYVAGDVNGSCSFSGLDITYMVRFFKGGPGPIPCPDCPPGS
jgi:hypothetical protein